MVLMKTLPTMREIAHMSTYRGALRLDLPVFLPMTYLRTPESYLGWAKQRPLRLIRKLPSSIFHLPSHISQHNTIKKTDLT